MSRGQRWLLLALTPVMLVVGGSAYVVTSNAGLVWLSEVIERHTRGDVHFEGVRGALLAAQHYDRIVVRLDGQLFELIDIQIEWQPSALLQGELALLNVSVRQLDMTSVASNTPSAAPTLPASLQLPLKMSALQVQVESLRSFSREGAAPDWTVTQIALSLHSNPAQHQLQLQSAQLPVGKLQGSLQLATLPPFALTAQAALAAALKTPKQIERVQLAANLAGDLQHMALTLEAQGAGVRANGVAQIAPFDAVLLQRLQLNINGLNAARLLPGAPLTQLAGKADLRADKRGQMVGEVHLANAQAASFNAHGIPVTRLDAYVTASPQLIQLRQLEVALLQAGRIQGTFEWNMSSALGNAQLALQNVDVQLFDSTLASRQFAGEVALQGAGHSQHAELSVTDGTLAVKADATHDSQKITLHSVRFSQGEAVFEGRGYLMLDRQRSFRLTSELSKLNLAEFSQAPTTNLNAAMDVFGMLRPQAQGALTFNLHDSVFAQHDIGGKGRVVWAGGQRGEGEVPLYLGNNQLNAAGSYGIGHDFVRMDIAAADLSQLDAALGGKVNVHAELTGSVGEPKLDFVLKGRDLRLPATQNIAAVDAEGEISAQEIAVNVALKDFSQAALRIPAASLEMRGTPERNTLKAQARVEQGLEVQEDLQLQATGAWQEAEQGWRTLRWQGMLESLIGNGTLPLRLLAGAPLDVSAAALSLGEADLALGRGQVHLATTRWSPAQWESDGSFTGLGVRSVNINSDAPALAHAESLRFGGAWQVKMDSHWDALLQVQRESGDWALDSKTGEHLGLTDLRMTARVAQDNLQTQWSVSGTTVGELKLEAHAPLTLHEGTWSLQTDAPVTGHLKLDSPELSWLGEVLDSNLQTGGKLSVDADVLGTLYTPRLRGTLRGEALKFAMLEQGVKLDQGQVNMRFEPNWIHLDQFEFNAPYLPAPKDKLLGDFKLSGDAGKLSASGSLDLNGEAGGVKISVQRFPLLQRADRWMIASGTGNARFAKNALALDAQLRADAGLIDQPVSNRPQLAEDVQILGSEVKEQPLQRNHVRATLDLGEHFYIRAAGLEARLEGKLDVRGEPNQPLSVTGVINAQDALFDAYGQRLQVERGMVNFQGQIDDPGLNILAYRKGLSVEAGVEVTGTARHPVIQLVSTPNVPDAEKLSWMVLGRVPDSSGIDSSLLLSAASNILGGGSASKIGRAVGVDELSLQQKAGGDPLMGQVVTVGKRLNQRAYLSYEQGLAATAGITKFTYTLNSRVTIVTRTGVEDALDLFYSFRFR
ncbi:MAG: hypothetical protein HOO97_06905 [Sideroxydans sp.]|nr:hypothetical protein [Sideroxydans sp.]